MNVVGRYVAQVDLVDAHAVVHVERHARGCDVIGDAEVGACRKLRAVPCLACERVLRHAVSASRVCLLHGADDLEEARASADAVRLEGGGDGEADRLARAALVCNHEMRRQRVQPALDTFDRGIERFEVDGDIRALLHLYPSHETV